MEVDDASSSTLMSVSIDTSRTIAYLSMRIYYGASYSGFRLLDSSMQTIVEVEHNTSGSWSDPQEIQEGQQIIGLQVHTPDDDNVLRHFTFLLSPPQE